MTVYGLASINNVSVGQTGHQHTRAARDADNPTPFAVDCSVCEPYLVREGYVYDPTQVPLTRRQQEQKERLEREGDQAVHAVSAALARTAGQMLATGEAAPRPRRRSPN